MLRVWKYFCVITPMISISITETSGSAFIGLGFGETPIQSSTVKNLLIAHRYLDDGFILNEKILADGYSSNEENLIWYEYRNFFDKVFSVIELSICEINKLPTGLRSATLGKIVNSVIKNSKEVFRKAASSRLNSVCPQMNRNYYEVTGVWVMEFQLIRLREVLNQIIDERFRMM